MLFLTPPNIVLNNCISVETAAAVSGYSRQYLRRMLRQERLSGWKLGQLWLVDLGSLEAYLEQAERSQDLRFGPKHPCHSDEAAPESVEEESIQSFESNDSSGSCLKDISSPDLRSASSR